MSIIPGVSLAHNTTQSILNTLCDPVLDWISDCFPKPNNYHIILLPYPQNRNPNLMDRLTAVAAENGIESRLLEDEKEGSRQFTVSNANQDAILRRIVITAPPMYQIMAVTTSVFPIHPMLLQVPGIHMPPPMLAVGQESMENIQSRNEPGKPTSFIERPCSPTMSEAAGITNNIIPVYLPPEQGYAQQSRTLSTSTKETPSYFRNIGHWDSKGRFIIYERPPKKNQTEALILDDFWVDKD